MSKVIGIDPDCKKSGLAVYEDGKLTGLLNLTLAEYCQILPGLAEEGAEIAIEDGSLNQFSYSVHTNPKEKLSIKLKRARDVGRNNQQAVVMGELAEAAGLKVARYKPCAGNWENKNRSADKNRFLLENSTGWEGASNPETRSAAYFGWKHLTCTTR